MSKYWQYVKKRPALFIGAAVAFGLLLFIVTRSGGGGAVSGGGVISQGPSEALQAQAMSINAGVATAQLSANTALANAAIEADMANNRSAMELEALTRQIDGQENLALLSMRGMMAELDANRTISSEQTQASLAALNSQLSFGLAQTEANNQASVDMARIAADSNTQQLAINAMMQTNLANVQADMVRETIGLQRDQMQTQAVMFMSAQETAFKQSALATIPQLRGSTGARVLTDIVNSPRTNFAGALPAPNSGSSNPPINPSLFMIAPNSNPAVMI